MEDNGDLNFDDERIRLTVLTNVCRMWITRGYMDINKYKPSKQNPPKKVSIVPPVSLIDHIDNSRVLPLIENAGDNNVYILPLDKPYNKNSVESKQYDPMKVIVKIIPQSFKDVGNSPIVNDFLSSYEDNHKVIIFDGMTDKVYNVLSKKKHIEVFDRDYFMIDLMSYECAPISCKIVSEKDIEYITNAKLPKIYKSDPLTRYYNGEKGEIMKIINPSVNNSRDVIYKKIIDK